ncbi:putative CDC50/LEM3 family protein [Rosa chinensis]|uniref:ALA-interacting subunit n=1 Tax=Rosa chinensis TaxID=74649 RepID=A0A2P6RFU2_ROSCH|nr:ALA-interacting subunit 3 [Rosa chinensis]PRQ45303.1 putative CDC50/LEM3 family protein [Rosa chinensis]
MTPKGDKGKEGDSSFAKKKSRRPKYSRFSQQELPACKPILSPGWVVSIFITIGIVFIPIGFAALFASERVVELQFQYDQDCVPAKYKDNAVAYIQSNATDKTCTRKMPAVTSKMKSPIYVYYQIDHYFQNHRRYVKSRSDDQLRSVAKENSTSDCAPERFAKNGQPIVPCGLVAWSLFNDTYKFSVKNKTIAVSKKDITWKSDREKKFSSSVYPKNFQSGGLIGGAKLNSSIPLSQQEDLIVWMRTAAMPSFRKLYGRIEVDLDAHDEITIELQNNYNTYSFKGSKSVILSTASWIGGKNDLMGIAYLTIGGMCLFLAICFILMYVLKPRPLGDTSYLSWNRNASGGRLNF